MTNFNYVPKGSCGLFDKKVYAIIIPVHNEEDVIGEILADLLDHLPRECVVGVGLNACTDRSRDICEERGVIIGETNKSGYGWGCQVAIDAVEKQVQPAAYLFFAGDSANTPADLERLIEAFRDGKGSFIMGVRTFHLTSWLKGLGRALPNLILGIASAILGERFFHDLAPLRLIERELFRKLQLRELVWGWTVEAQIRAAILGERIFPIPVDELPRRGGQQKVSGVSLPRSTVIGWEILKAAWRTKWSKYPVDIICNFRE